MATEHPRGPVVVDTDVYSARSTTKASCTSSNSNGSAPTAPRAKTASTAGTTTTGSAAGTATVRLHGNADDERRQLNRPENVRPISPKDPDFHRLFRQRNDAESVNRGLDDTLFLRRAHSIGHRRQWINLLGFALMVNSLALAEHRKPQLLAA